MTTRLRPALLGLLLACALPQLSGCVPIIAGGVVGAAAMATDRRSSGTYVDDESTEWKIGGRLNDALGDRVHANVTSFNRIVLLTGEAFDEQAKSDAERIAREQPNVRGVTNELRIAPTSAMSARATDSYVSSKVKARFVDQQKFRPQHVKVVTEAGTVYLMGLVTHAEAEAATEIARTTDGVRKVVRVFEYIADDDAARLDRATPDGAEARRGGPRTS